MKTPPDTAHYRVFLYDQHVGQIQRRLSSTRFVFEESYLASQNRAILGLGFEENLTKAWSGIGRLPEWFSNLLPEGKLREWVGAAQGVSVHQEMDLLARLGHDLPGAVRVVASSDPLPVGTSWLEPEDPSPTSRGEEHWRFSLAGVGMKFSMLEGGGRFTAPAVGERGDWIVKTPDQSHACVPYNEYAMMTLARHAGIEVPEVRLVSRDALGEIPHGVWGAESFAFAVRRFDRGPERQLIHIEDFAQVRGWYPEQKYRGKFESLAGYVYRGHDTDSLREFARRLTFNALIGNGDAHLKNWSLIYRDKRRPTLSPAYDIVSTVPYIKRDDAGLSFCGSKEFGSVSPGCFRRLERKLRSQASLDDVVEQVTKRALVCVEIAADILNPIAPDMAHHIVQRVKSESARFLRTPGG